MRVLIINSVCGIRSTGRICTELAKKLEKEGYQVKIAYGRVEEVPPAFQKYAVRIGTDWDLKMHAMRTRLLDQHGFGSQKATRIFLQWAEQYDPDILWLHNIHGYYINVEMLFKWIKSRPQMQVKWTLHDCWPFTGHCAYFSAVGCSRWKEGCGHCVQTGQYPISWGLDNSQQNYIRKKAAFTGVMDLTLYTPSHWLANLVRQSFLGQYPICVEYNTVDTTVFKPTPGDFRQRFGLTNKKIILGVASVWEERKGLNDFLQLADRLDDSFVIVLIGLTDKQKKLCKSNMIGLRRTNNLQELAQVYTAADVFLNPSREETFGLTTVEALACGTSAVVYENTACEEIVNQYGGIAVPFGVEHLYKAVQMLTSRNNEQSGER